MNAYNIISANGENWEIVPTLRIDTLLWTDATDVAAFAQICHDADAFYMRLWAKESDVRAEEHGPLGMPCEDSCLEFFFCPMEGDRRYFNIEFNPNLCLYLGIGSSLNNHMRLIPNNINEIFAPYTARMAAGWEVRYRIPLEFIRRFFPDFALLHGATIRANCYKCGDRTAKPHYLAWNPVGGNEPAFHRPDEFGVMRIL